MNQNDWLVVGGLAALYFVFKKPSSAYPQYYPTPTTGTQPKPSTTGGGGITGGGGSSGGGGTSSGGSSGWGVTSVPYGPPLQSGGTLPSGTDSGDPCDPTSTAYDPQTCASYTGQPVDSMDPCNPSSSVYDPSVCNSGNTIPVDSGNPCDPSSYAYDPSLCGGSGGGDGTDYNPDAMQML